ncbi:signal recognition particle GTPase [Salinibacter ruber]|uniref:flagellar biosynthesis protein FlhF n=1 Tax=Salinibacter ruber TaxID=146919 RepID=UPI00216A6BF2|nr:flagellar biosynthesis protein FlhF [Salinibacter ruber]MCS4193865.1 signal recognition particle GTPase [Salinibacter ruber]
MDVKTFTDSSIQAALEKARHKLGDQVVLVESEPSTDEAPAQVTVMVDESAQQAATQGEPSWGHVPKPSDAPASPPSTSPPSTSPAPDPGGEDDGAALGYEADEAAGPPGAGRASRFQSELEAQSRPEADASGQGPGRGRVFPASDAEGDGASTTGDHEAWVESRLAELRARGGDGHDRTARLAGAETDEWATHPLYGRLLEDGLRPKTATALFGDLTERGVDPRESPRDELHWALAQVVCRRIQTDPLTDDTGVIALVGPSGAGKTSLALKLAVHDRMLARQDTAVLHLCPEAGRNASYQNPTALYRRFGLPVRSVRTKEDMAKALRCVGDFEQVLIDTPPLPMPLSEARPVLRRYRRLLRPLPRPDVHFVVDATRALGGIDEATFARLPLRPTAAAVTHLDEVHDWGQVAEWLIHVDLPVQIVSEGPEVPDGARAFSLRWFVEDVMDL